MSDGTASRGKRSGKKNMVFCRRCGKRTLHVRKKKCSSCGYGDSPKKRSYNWKKKGK